MIIVKFQGGLGNQMFQYALGRALAQRTEEQVYYDKSWYKHIPSSDTPRIFELDIFSLPLMFAEESQVPFESRPLRNESDRLVRGIFRRLPVLKKLFGLASWNNISDGSLDALQDVLKITAGQNVYLNGYWQSEKYFKDAALIVREDFIFREAPDERNSIILSKIAADLASGVSSVSVHIRRGDYSSNPITNAYHGLLPLDYYRSAMSLIEERCSKVSYYVFSDDLSWCQENLKFNAPATFVDVNAGKPGWTDMRLMSACRHHIIANSSFSWWGAWLNASTDKIVIAPQQWHSDTNNMSKDIVPENWLKV